MNYTEILEDCNNIINKYKPDFHDSFKKNLKIYNQAKIIKTLIEKYNLDQSKHNILQDLQEFQNYFFHCTNNIVSFLESTLYEIFHETHETHETQLSEQNETNMTRNINVVTQSTQTELQNTEFEIIN